MTTSLQRRALARYGWWITAVAAPPVIFIIVLLTQQGSSWRTAGRVAMAQAGAAALIANAVFASLAAPVAGVAAAARALARSGGERRPDIQTASAVAAGALIFSVSSLVTTTVAWQGQPEAFLTLTRAHAVLGAAALALGAAGLLAGRLFRHPLDAAGASTALAALALFAVLAGGPSLSDAPAALIAGLVLASPLVMTAAAAGIDVFRTEVLYHVSPLAHVSFTYPAWPVATAAYVAIAVLAGAGFLLRRPS